MDRAEINLHSELKKYFGFSQFKGLQEEVIKSIIKGENTFVIMPTGGGKSLCYQLPALIKEGTAIVVSPLIALMKNQVDALRSLSEEHGVAHVLNSSLNKGEVKQVMSDISNGITKLLYVAPESLTKEDYVNFLKTVPISFMAVDEAHCISEWGHDFRPEYRNLRQILERIGENIPIIGLTATATPKVQEDILKSLGMTDANTFKASFNRPNLYYEVRPKTKQVDADIIRFVKQNEGKSGIVYCLSRKRVEELAQVLQVNGIKAVPYHAGLDAKTRVKHQDMFLMEDVDVVVATIAFGMGIDKPDVRFVIHHDIPKSIESYYQETGRAGPMAVRGTALPFMPIKTSKNSKNLWPINRLQNRK
jgi:ATP-dependent DNA helicase RecQ